MKIRNGFISNSSSSSFVLISNRGNYDPDEIMKYLKKKKSKYSLYETTYRLNLPIKSGCFCFGRQYKNYKTLADKLNLITYFILSRKIYCNSSVEDWEKTHQMEEMVENAVKTVLIRRSCERGHRPGENEIDVSLAFDYNAMFMSSQNRYGEVLDVDHQSDSPENMKMFESSKAMYNFLFNDASAICNGSDEEYPTFEYEAAAKEYRDIYGEYPWTIHTEEDLNFNNKDLIQVHEREERPDEELEFGSTWKERFQWYKKRVVVRQWISWKFRTLPFVIRMKRQGKYKQYKKWWEERDARYSKTCK